MGTAALFDLLPDFGARTQRPTTAAHGATEPLRSSHPTAPSPDTQTLVAEAVARAEAELEARLTLAHQTALEAERQAHADERKAFLESLGGDMGKAVAGHLDVMETRIADLTATAVARILGGLISDDLQKRSIEALARTIRETVGDAEAVRIAVRGPLSLFEPLQEALGSRAGNLDFSEAPGFDLTVAIDETVFETRMSEWSAALAEVLA